MKKIKIETKLDFKTFVDAMENGCNSGSGNGETFTFSNFKGSPLTVSADLILAYDLYRMAKQILINQLTKEK